EGRCQVFEYAGSAIISVGREESLETPLGDPVRSGLFIGSEALQISFCFSVARHQSPRCSNAVSRAAEKQNEKGYGERRTINRPPLRGFGNDRRCSVQPESQAKSWAGPSAGKSLDASDRLLIAP